MSTSAPPNTEPLVRLVSGPGLNSLVQAIELTSGVTRWETSYPYDGTQALAVGDGLVAVATGGGALYCIHHETGEALWSARVPTSAARNDEQTAALLIEAGTVVVHLGFHATAFDAEGAQLWQHKQGYGIMGTTRRVSVME